MLPFFSACPLPAHTLGGVRYIRAGVHRRVNWWGSVSWIMGDLRERRGEGDQRDQA